MFLIKVFTFNPVEENTYLLYNERQECIVIDPGMYYEEENDAILNFMNEEKLVPRLLLNTHCHLDHVFGNKYISEKYGLILQAHALEEKMLQLAPASALMYNLPFDNYQGEISFLKEGDEVVLGEDVLQVLHAPGHSPGSICFYCEKQQFIIGGDVLFLNSIGRTDLPFGNHGHLISSIKEKIFTLPGDVKVYPGHGAPTTIGEEKRSNPFLQ